jgi:hypothetical protein
MANIQSISRGYKTSSYEAVFKPATGKTFVAGDLVSLISADTIDYANLGATDETVVYMVLEGNDTYSGQQTKRVVVLGGIFETTVKDYNTGSYTVNTPLTVASGKFSVKTSTYKTVATVLDFSLSQGLKVRFND